MTVWTLALYAIAGCAGGGLIIFIVEGLFSPYVIKPKEIAERKDLIIEPIRLGNNFADLGAWRDRLQIFENSQRSPMSPGELYRMISGEPGSSVEQFAWAATHGVNGPIIAWACMHFSERHYRGEIRIFSNSEFNGHAQAAAWLYEHILENLPDYDELESVVREQDASLIIALEENSPIWDVIKIDFLRHIISAHRCEFKRRIWPFRLKETRDDWILYERSVPGVEMKLSPYIA